METFRPILRRIPLGDGVALSPQISGPVSIEFIDGHLGGVGSHQQGSMASGGFVDGGGWGNACQRRGKVGDGNGCAVGLLQHAGGRAHLEGGLALVQFHQPIIGIVGGGRGLEDGLGGSHHRPLHSFIHLFGQGRTGGDGHPQHLRRLVPSGGNHGKPLTPQKVGSKVVHHLLLGAFYHTYSPIAMAEGGRRVRGVTLAAA